MSSLINDKSQSYVPPHSHQFNLSSNAVAPFVYLESRNVLGRFSDNGFTILKGGQIFMSFESWEKFDVKQFSSGLSIR